MRAETRQKVVEALEAALSAVENGHRIGMWIVEGYKVGLADKLRAALALLSEDAPPGPNRTLNEAAAALAGTVRWALRSHHDGLAAALGSQETEAMKDELVVLEVALRSEDAPEPAGGAPWSSIVAQAEEAGWRAVSEQLRDELDALKAELEEARSTSKGLFGALKEYLAEIDRLRAQLSEPSGGRGDLEEVAKEVEEFIGHTNRYGEVMGMGSLDESITSWPARIRSHRCAAPPEGQEKSDG